MCNGERKTRCNTTEGSAFIWLLTPNTLVPGSPYSFSKAFEMIPDSGTILIMNNRHFRLVFLKNHIFLFTVIY